MVTLKKVTPKVRAVRSQKRVRRLNRGKGQLQLMLFDFVYIVVCCVLCLVFYIVVFLVIPEGENDDGIEVVDEDVVMVDKSEGARATHGDEANQTHSGKPMNGGGASKKRPTRIEGIVGEVEESSDAKKPKI